MTFSERTVVVTGATSGIGRAAALAFARQRASIVLVGRDAAALAEVTAAVAKAGGRSLSCEVDLMADDAPARIVNAAIQMTGVLDVLVNAAGVIATGPVESTSDEEWDRMMSINVRAPFRLMRESVPHLTARRGTIINVSSVNGLRAFAGLAAYNTSKAAIDHLTRCAALELAPAGVRVNAVNPGVTVTNLHKRSGMGDAQYAAFLERAKETHPLGRPGQPDEVAALIVFLASDQAGWMTGETIPIDGGRHLTCLR